MGEGFENRDFISSVVDKIKEVATPREQSYSFDKLWKQRKKTNSHPLIIKARGPRNEKIGIGFRDVHEYFGKHYLVLGIFSLGYQSSTPVGYLVAEHDERQGILYSQTIDRSKLTKLKNDKIFGPLADFIRGGRTIEVDWDYQKRGLGTTLVKTMLEVGQKINAPELYFGDVSGYLSKLAKSLDKQENITLKIDERSGNLSIKNKKA